MCRTPAAEVSRKAMDGSAMMKLGTHDSTEGAIIAVNRLPQ